MHIKQLDLKFQKKLLDPFFTNFLSSCHKQKLMIPLREFRAKKSLSSMQSIKKQYLHLSLILLQIHIKEHYNH